MEEKIKNCCEIGENNKLQDLLSPKQFKNLDLQLLDDESDCESSNFEKAVEVKEEHDLTQNSIPETDKSIICVNLSTPTEPSEGDDSTLDYDPDVPDSPIKSQYLTPIKITNNLESPQKTYEFSSPEKSPKLKMKRNTEEKLLSQYCQNSECSYTTNNSNTSNSNESIVISDEEVNYSIKRYLNDPEEDNHHQSTQEVDAGEEIDHENNIIDLCDESLVEILDKEVSNFF